MIYPTHVLQPSRSLVHSGVNLDGTLSILYFLAILVGVLVFGTVSRIDLS